MGCANSTEEEPRDYSASVRSQRSVSIRSQRSTLRGDSPNPLGAAASSPPAMSIFSTLPINDNDDVANSQSFNGLGLSRRSRKDAEEEEAAEESDLPFAAWSGCEESPRGAAAPAADGDAPAEVPPGFREVDVAALPEPQALMHLPRMKFKRVSDIKLARQ